MNTNMNTNVNEYEIYVIPLDGGYEMRVAKAATTYDPSTLAEGYAFHEACGVAVPPEAVELPDNRRASAVLMAHVILGWEIPPHLTLKLGSDYVQLTVDTAQRYAPTWKI